MALRHTRRSLSYLANYLLIGGLVLVIAPRLALELLAARGDYGDVLPRLTGLLALGLGIVITQMRRLHVEAMYPTTLVVRAVFLPGFVALYVYSADPLFLVLLGIVGVGFLWTLLAWLADRRSP